MVEDEGNAERSGKWGFVEFLQSMGMKVKGLRIVRKGAREAVGGGRWLGMGSVGRAGNDST